MSRAPFSSVSLLSPRLRQHGGAVAATAGSVGAAAATAGSIAAVATSSASDPTVTWSGGAGGCGREGDGAAAACSTSDPTATSFINKVG